MPAGTPQRSAENLVLVLLGLAALFALGFIVVYGEFSPAGMSNALLGICLGVSLAVHRPGAHRRGQTPRGDRRTRGRLSRRAPGAAAGDRSRSCTRAGRRITRKRLLIGASAAAGGTLGLAALTPALSLGPIWDTAPLDQTPWRRGVRLVDDTGAPLRAADLLHQSFYTAFPEGADKELIGASLVVIRLDPGKLHLPDGRADWAPERDHGVLQDLHPRRLRGGALPQPEVPGRPAVTRRWCARATTRPLTRSPAGR